MTKVEKQIAEFLIKNKNLLFFAVITVMGAYLRFYGLPLITSDMEGFLLPWYYEILDKGGLQALGSQVGDYGLLYQTILAGLTYINWNPVYLIKFLPLIFDFLLCIMVPYFFCQITKKEILGFEYNIIYALLMFLPTFVINSAYWGQSDSIYSLFVLLTLFSIYKGEYKRSAVYYGLAFAFKLQAIFILPFIIAYYFYSKRMSARNALITLLVFWGSGIVAYFNGRSLAAPFTIYAMQSDEHAFMFMNFPSAWMLVGYDYYIFKTMAIVVALAALGVGLFIVLSKKVSIDSLEDFLKICAWFIWTALIFMPSMHDRYAYYLDIILILLCVLNRKYIKYASVSLIMSTLAYCDYLFYTGYINIYSAVVYLAAYLAFTYCQCFKFEKTELSV